MVTEIIRSNDDVVFVRWVDVTAEGVQRVVVLTQALHRQHGPVTFIGLAGNTMVVPDEAARQHMVLAIDQMMPLVRSMNLVFDGTGLRFVAIRSAGAAMFLLKGDRRMKMYSSLREVLADRVPTRVEELMTFAKTEGLLPKETSATSAR